MRRSLLLLTLLPVMATCVPSVRPPAVPAPQPTPVVALPPPPPAADWRDWAVTPGSWRYARAGLEGSTATFGTGADGYLMRMECNVRAGQVTLATTGGPGAPPLTIRTSSTERRMPTVAVTHAGGVLPVTRNVRLAASDPLLDAIAFSRGHFTMEAAGRPPLVIPARPEIARVVEDCRG